MSRASAMRCWCTVAATLAGVSAGADGGPYVGLSATAALFDVHYHKGVDSRHSGNFSPNAGTILFANDSAGATTWDAGLLVGYRLGGGVLNLDLEIDVVTHGGEAASRLAGAGASPGNNQLGEVWPENWSVTKDRSYGLTVRLGVPVTPFGAEAFAFAGARRLDAEYRTSYTGCPIVGGCRADQLLSNAERHEQRFDAFTAGLGVEQEVAGIVLRAELRYTDYGKTNHITPFEDLFVTVPWELESGETGVGLSVLWRP